MRLIIHCILILPLWFRKIRADLAIRIVTVRGAVNSNTRGKERDPGLLRTEKICIDKQNENKESVGTGLDGGFHEEKKDWVMPVYA